MSFQSAFVDVSAYRAKADAERQPTPQERAAACVDRIRTSRKAGEALAAKDRATQRIIYQFGPEPPVAKPPRVFVRDVQDIVAAFYSVTVNDITCSRRSNDIMRPRQVAMYLAKTF